MASSTNIKRETLKSKSGSFKDALTKNIDEIKSSSVSVGNAALIGGSIFLGGYLLYKMLSGTSDEEYEDIKEKMVIVHSPKQESFLMRSIKQSIATFLLAIAKQKLVESLKKIKVLYLVLQRFKSNFIFVTEFF